MGSRVWDQLQNSELPPDIKDLAKWEAEYNAMMSAQRDELLEGDSLEEMEKAWAEANIDGDTGFGLDRFKLDDDGRPNLGDYEFGTPPVVSLLTLTTYIYGVVRSE